LAFFFAGCLERGFGGFGGDRDLVSKSYRRNPPVFALAQFFRYDGSGTWGRRGGRADSSTGPNLNCT